ncbi:hypothetical protein [Pseudoalteromonas sp. JC3]|uniref:hypothetical protein n=1 Tax=Pseudoalteromonas sp. JC3 TaxID=2810196 RepID=UPI0019D17E9D|nr:hypothetical protein [Pseudoalteromonas sp. JC3]MBR8841924.1 hypothetical protein [Pseudoalteromonas sp. JC3]WJE08686.1 hypothetical protein QSH61_17810 [Pseudoalteromonas sp. JC3]
MSKKSLLIASATLLALLCLYWTYLAFDNIEENVITREPLQSNNIGQYQHTSSGSVATQPEETLSVMCNDYASDIDDMVSWQALAEQRIQYIFSSMQHQGLGENQLDYISKAAGLGILRGRMLRPESKYYQSVDAIPHYANGILSQRQADMFWAYLRSQDIKGLITAYQQNKIQASKRVSVYDTPVSLILTQLQGDNSNVISELTSSGILVTYQDLVTATQLGIAPTLMAQLLDASGLTPSEVWYDDELEHYTSLTNVAIAAINSELTTFWLKEGSPAIADPFSNNALDLLSPAPTDKADEVESIILLLLANGVRPSNELSSKRLLHWLSDGTLAQYKTQLQHVENAIPSEWQDEIESGVDKLYRAVLSDIVAPEKLSKAHPCFHSVGRAKIQLVFNREHAYEQLNNEQLQAVNVKEIKQSAESLVTTVTEQNTDPSMIVRVLGQEPDLLNKMAVDHYRYEQLKALLARHTEQQAQLSDEEKAKQAKLQEAITEAFTLAQKGNWQQAADHMTEQNAQIEQQEMLNALLTMAISTNASIDEITRLLEKGARLGPQTILNLVRTHNLPLIKALVKYDLDLHFVDPLGRNALLYAVLLRTPKIMTYLLRHKVSVKPDPYGLDALDFALEQVENGASAMELAAGNNMSLNDSFFYISQLLYAGAPIESSHKQRVAAYQNSNPILYKEIISAFPSFKL